MCYAEIAQSPYDRYFHTGNLFDASSFVYVLSLHSVVKECTAQLVGNFIPTLLPNIGYTLPNLGLTLYQKLCKTTQCWVEITHWLGCALLTNVG